MNRRHFIKLSGASLASLLVSNYTKAAGVGSMLIQMPDEIKVLPADIYYSLQSPDKQTWTGRDIVIKLKNTKKCSVGVYTFANNSFKRS